MQKYTSAERIKLSGFNNLTKILSFNLYDFCITFNDKEKDEYINWINEKYSSKKILDISRKICEIIEIYLPINIITYLDCDERHIHSQLSNEFMLNQATEEQGWIKVNQPAKYDLLIMSLGSTHVANHCSLYVDKDKMLQTMAKHRSWVAPYGKYYKQYTVGVYRWKTLNN